MKPKLIFLLLLFCNPIIHAHQDFYLSGKSKNVKYRIKTGYKFDEINKAVVIAKLAANLSQNLGYKRPILLDFDHFYVGHCEADYFLAFISHWAEFVFDSDSSFYFLSNADTGLISKKYILENAQDFARPYHVNSIGGEKFAINYSIWADAQHRKQRDITAVFMANEGILIQDFDKLIDSAD